MQLTRVGSPASCMTSWTLSRMTPKADLGVTSENCQVWPTNKTKQTKNPKLGLACDKAYFACLNGYSMWIKEFPVPFYTESVEEKQEEEGWKKIQYSKFTLLLFKDQTHQFWNKHNQSHSTLGLIPAVFTLSCSTGSMAIPLVQVFRPWPCCPIHLSHTSHIQAVEKSLAVLTAHFKLYLPMP